MKQFDILKRYDLDCNFDFLIKFYSLVQVILHSITLYKCTCPVSIVFLTTTYLTRGTKRRSWPVTWTPLPILLSPLLSLHSTYSLSLFHLLIPILPTHRSFDRSVVCESISSTNTPVGLNKLGPLSPTGTSTISVKCLDHSKDHDHRLNLAFRS
jgi:hypothetical protein